MNGGQRAFLFFIAKWNSRNGGKSIFTPDPMCVIWLVHLQPNVFNCLKLLSITGTNMCVDGKHQAKKGTRYGIARKGGKKKRY